MFTFKNPRSQCGGREFDPHRLHQFLQRSTCSVFVVDGLIIAIIGLLGAAITALIAGGLVALAECIAIPLLGVIVSVITAIGFEPYVYGTLAIATLSCIMLIRSIDQTDSCLRQNATRVDRSRERTVNDNLMY